MSKFIVTLGNEAYQLLQLEARRRDIRVQQLLRGVIIPEWMKQDSKKAPIAPRL
jgi:hypothetical protein